MVTAVYHDHVVIRYSWPDGAQWWEQYGTEEFSKVPEVGDRVLCEVNLYLVGG